jgi:hypothetical protein
MAAAFLALAGMAARAEVKTKVIDYTQGDTPLQGFLAWDDAAEGKRPGVLVVHEWWGLNQHARNQALRLAKAREEHSLVISDRRQRGNASQSRWCCATNSLVNVSRWCTSESSPG